MSVPASHPESNQPLPDKDEAIFQALTEQCEDSRLADGLHAFDVKRQLFYGGVEMVLSGKELSPEDRQAYMQAGNELPDEFRMVVEAAQNESYTDEEYVTAFTRLITEDQRERATIFAEATEDAEAFEMLTEKYVRAIVDKAIGEEGTSTAKVQQVMVDVYKRLYLEDLNELQQYLPENYAAVESEEITPTRVEYAREHLIDVMKIAAGTAIGVFLAQRFRK